MSVRLSNTVKTAILGAMALMFYSKISSGTLGYYINARFQWLPYLALVLLMAIALTLVYGASRLRRTTRLSDADMTNDMAAGEFYPGHTHQQSWWVYGLMAVPVVLGLLLPARSLSASAVGSRGLGGAAPARVAGVAPASVASTEGKTILDWLRDYGQSGSDASGLVGKPADIVGFVYRDKRNGSDEFWVARYTVSCCVADASGIGMIVHSQQSMALEEGTWVRVRGFIAAANTAGEEEPHLPMIEATSVTVVSQPDDPYLFP